MKPDRNPPGNINRTNERKKEEEKRKKEG